MQDNTTSGKPAGQDCAARLVGGRKEQNARLQYTGPLGGDGGQRHGRDLGATCATQARLDVLRAGGNAMDAAIAAVAVQCVVEPQSTGVGGDCFVLYSKKGAPPVAINGSGRAPAKATAEWFVERQMRDIEVQTPHAVTVPGAVDAWCQLIATYGIEAAVRAAGAGRAGRRGRLCRDAAGRLGLVAQQAWKLKESSHRETLAARAAGRPRPATR